MSPKLPVFDPKKNRILTGIILVAISLSTLFVWYWLIKDESLILHRLYLSLATAFGATGVFLAIGGPLAHRAYTATGLSAPTRPETKALVTLLQLSALWHLSILGIFAASSLIGFFGTSLVYGYLPVVFIPFCSRMKTWALWLLLIVCFGLFLLLLVVNLVGLTGLSSGRLTPEDLLPSAVYCIGVGAVVVLAVRALLGAKRLRREQARKTDSNT